MTCQTCGEPTPGGPLCLDCAAERREHRTAKARMRAELARRRHTPKRETRTEP